MEKPIEQIEAFVNEAIQDADIFLVKLNITPKNDIKLFLDGDNGLPINAITKINRSVYKMIEEAAIFPEGDFSMEVSSPGVDEPLVLIRQYNKHIGRNIEFTLEEEVVVVGKLLEINEEGVLVEETIDKKKKLTTQHNISFNQIQKAIVQISF